MTTSLALRSRTPRADGRQRFTGRSRRLLLLVVALALVLRLGVIAATPDLVPAYDGVDFQRIAAGIAETGGYPSTTYAAPGTPSAFRPPAWPFTLGAVYAITGSHPVVGRLVGALLGTVGVLLLALIGRELWGVRAGLMAGGVAALFPALWFSDTALLSEPLFTVCVLGMTLLLLIAPGMSRPRRWLACAGALAGVAILTRSQGFVLLLPLVVAGWRLPAAGQRASAASAALAVGVALATLVPWTARNAEAFGTLVPVTTQAGYTLVGTYNSTAAAAGPAYGAARAPMLLPELKSLFGRPDLDEAQLDRSLSVLGRSFAASHPRYDIEVAVKNSARLLTLGGPDQQWLTRLSNREMGMPKALDGLVSLNLTLLLALAVAGAIVLLRRSPGAPRARGPIWLWAIPVLLWGSTVIVSGAPRYRAVVDPFFLLLAAAAASWWLERRRSRPRLEVA